MNWRRRICRWLNFRNYVMRRRFRAECGAMGIRLLRVRLFLIAIRETQMPTFKRQDQEQIEKAKDLLENGAAGEMGFVKSLFFGRLALHDVFPYPRQDRLEADRVSELMGKLEPFLKDK